MTLRQRTLPFIPADIIDSVGSNLKLYSDAHIKEMKKQFKADGKYQHFIKQSGEKEQLPYAIYVCGGQYYAAVSGQLMRSSEAGSGKIKIIQNLDSGRWGEAKVVDGVTQDEINNELAVIHKAGQVMQADSQSNYFYRASECEVSVRRDGKTIYPSLYEADNPDWRPDDSDGQVIKNGKHYLLSRFAHGVDLAKWVHRKPGLPIIVKIELAEQLVMAVMDIHASHMLHRNIKLQNVIADAFARFSKAITLVNVGSPQIYRHANVESEISALGLTLHYLFRESPTPDSREISQDTLLRLNALFEAMQHPDSSCRKALADVLLELKNIKLILSETERTIKVGMLNVIDFIMYESSGQLALKHLLEQLRSYDQVSLHGEDDAVTDFAFLKVKHKLEKAGIVVSNVVSTGSVQEMRACLLQNGIKRTQCGKIFQTSFFDAGVEINENDTRIRMDVDEGEVAHRFDDEEYAVGECVVAFFSNVFTDGIGLLNSAVTSCFAGFGGLYRDTDSQARRIEIENAVGFEARLTDADIYRLT